MCVSVTSLLNGSGRSSYGFFQTQKITKTKREIGV